MFAVANTALINMLMASRLIYGMARQHVLPPVLGAVHPTRLTPWVAIIFTTLIAFGLIFYVHGVRQQQCDRGAGRHHVAAAAGGVRGGQRRGAGAAARRQRGRRALQDADRAAGHRLLASLYLVTPLSGRPAQQYLLALILVVIGIVLFFVTWRSTGSSVSATPASPTRRTWVPRRISRPAPADRGQLALCLSSSAAPVRGAQGLVGVGLLCRTPPRCGCGIGWQRRRHDVAGRGVAVVVTSSGR